MKEERTILIFQLMYHAYLLLKDECAQLFQANPITELLAYLLANPLELCVKPYCDLTSYGNIETLYKALPAMTRLISHGERPHLIKLMFFYLTSNEHLLENRPDVLVHIAKNCTPNNEVCNLRIVC